MDQQQGKEFMKLYMEGLQGIAEMVHFATPFEANIAIAVMPKGRDDIAPIILTEVSLEKLFERIKFALHDPRVTQFDKLGADIVAVKGPGTEIN